MDSTTYFLLFLSLSLLNISPKIHATNFKTPRLISFKKNLDALQTESKVSKSRSGDFVMFYYTQTLDHFNYKPESYMTFKQRYAINFKHWGGPKSNSPIFVFFGAEENLDDAILAIGFLTDNAPHFKALLVYIEHRFYGKSIPFGGRKEALRKANYLGYLNSAQALADCASIITHIKEKYSAKDSPVIVTGGSYGGLLVSWFRLKYPHIALGALASSAPILSLDDIAPRVGYYSIVTKTFKDFSTSCHDTISKSWGVIEKVASKPHGLSFLSKKFKACRPLNRTKELKDYLDSIYSEAAQYNYPPPYPVSVVCDGINGGPKSTDVLSRIFAGVVAYMGDKSCYDLNEFSFSTNEYLAWNWQTCSEMVMPIGHEKGTMFPTQPFNMTSYVNGCTKAFGIEPRPHWVTTYYGTHDLKLILRRFGSNIIFSNGLRDPYSPGGILENISDSIIALPTVNGSHCVDLRGRIASDPDWLVSQRQTEVKIIEGWISKYYVDLVELKDQH